MGIQGLLPLLKSIHRPIELKKYAGETFGVDAYGWLHRGAISCAVELAQGIPTRKYVDFAMHRVRMVKHFGVTPYMVFDGDFLPSKANTEAARAERREASRKAGLELLKAGKPSQAYIELQKAIDVTPEMARSLIEELKKASIPYVVAPYEADAQLVYLERRGIISGIISEDSDLLVFGAKRLLTKLDPHGQCVEINRRDFCAVREISLTGWSDAEFRHMAILSGCDYLESINNMGLKTAYRMIRKHKTPERVIRMLQFDGKYKVPEGYLARFKQAELTFLHQRVFCPQKRELVLLTEPDSSSLDIETLPFIGAPVDPDLARSVAVGDVNPISKQPIVLTVMPVPRRDSQNNTVRTTQTQRPAQPIDTYFKGGQSRTYQRIPLGEMDPNCFRVQSGNARSRESNEPIPRVFPLPRPYVESPQTSGPVRPYSSTVRPRRRTEPILNVRRVSETNSSSQARRRTDGPLDRTADVQAHCGMSQTERPLKKVRLCEDELPSVAVNNASEKSKFFSSKTGKKTTKTLETTLFSDDSIEDTLLSLPDVGERLQRSPTTKPMFEVFDEQDLETRIVPKSNDCECEANSDIEVPVSSPMRRVSRNAREDSPAETPLRPSLRQFSYRPDTSRTPLSSGTRFAHGLPTPASSTHTSDSSQNSTPSEESLFGRMATPLQRIGARAMQRGLGQSVPALTSDGLGLKKMENRRRSYVSLPVNPSFVPLPKPDITEAEALSRFVGSEDQIVPDSDVENEDAGSEATCLDGEGRDYHQSMCTSRLDLSKFRYV
ncbi:hypothetical protein VTK73DRAFT_4079 [Phialemonium thermophilum]|uniref:Exonuclease 1 n=1 Tax=Phialemonium thermophilum TaxID=223376 RepID=A0ABR3WVY2_9PEZI